MIISFKVKSNFKTNRLGGKDCGGDSHSLLSHKIIPGKGDFKTAKY